MSGDARRRELLDLILEHSFRRERVTLSGPCALYMRGEIEV